MRILLYRAEVRQACSVFLLSILVAVGPIAAEDRFGLHLGIFDVDGPDDTLLVDFEYRFRPRVWQLAPFAGAGFTLEEAGIAFVGLRRAFALGAGMALTPSFAVAAFEEGEGKDLGRALEFRSGLELEWRAGPRSRMGIGLYHLSNGGYGRINPGADALVLSYSRLRPDPDRPPSRTGR